jgi:tRNA (mo5U34)-methyltransferase
VGEFDFAVIGTLLLHLRDPIGGLMCIRRVLTGNLLVNDVVSIGLSVLRARRPCAELIGFRDRPFWSLPNLAALRRYVHAAGFEIIRSGRPYLVRNGAGYQPAPLRRRDPVGGSIPSQLLLRLGSPHSWILARPVGK